MANKIRNAFGSIKADEKMKESTKRFISAQAENQRTVRTPVFRKRAAVFGMIAAFAIGIVVGIRGYSWVQTPVSYVSIDINPSIELGLNRFDRVVTAEAYNEEGEEILNNLSLKWKKCTDAMEAVVESEGMRDYLTDENELVFTTAADGGRSPELQSEVEDFSGGTGHNCHSYSEDIEIVSEAHDNGLSLGKYYAYLQMAQYDDTVTVDSCRDMSVSHMHGLAQAHGQNGNHGNEENHGNQENMENSGGHGRHGWGSGHHG